MVSFDKVKRDLSHFSITTVYGHRDDIIYETAQQIESPGQRKKTFNMANWSHHWIHLVNELLLAQTLKS